MARHFPRQDWVAELAERSGRTRDTVEWHLQQEMTPPAEIGEAAAAMRAANPASNENDEPERGGELMTEDDLPFSGLPGNLGKLHRD
ncbi:hypothetical protein ASE66_28060 [Bosea sp. Root483D1]|nr:hypothetical protein ASE66_28060 [Bosea sp. Root483D1]